MALMMLPLTVLYLISIVFASFAGRRRRIAQERNEADYSAS
jgi:Sec-independent protein secretion pathway component TatC